MSSDPFPSSSTDRLLGVPGAATGPGVADTGICASVHAVAAGVRFPSLALMRPCASGNLLRTRPLPQNPPRRTGTICCAARKKMDGQRA
jgi:hypothetical protein